MYVNAAVLIDDHTFLNEMVETDSIELSTSDVLSVNILDPETEEYTDVPIGNQLRDTIADRFKFNGFSWVKETLAAPRSSLAAMFAILELNDGVLEYPSDYREEILKTIVRHANNKLVTTLVRGWNKTNPSKKFSMKELNQACRDQDLGDQFVYQSYGPDGAKYLSQKNAHPTDFVYYFHNLPEVKFIVPTPQKKLGEAPCEILRYSSRVEDYIPTHNTDETRFGIELELENATETNIKLVHSLLKTHAIMKRDGSLNNGVEIVSIPSTVAHHKEVYKSLFDSKHTLEAKENCGIHIHVTRTKSSFLALGRMMKFMAVNRDLVYKIAGRKSDTYARIDSGWDLTTPWYAVNNTDKYKKNPKFNWSKYTGLNIAPDHTMEFRLFKSTTNYAEFCRFLDFTAAVVDYCNLVGSDQGGKIRKIQDMFDFGNFKHFVTNRGSSYPELNKFIQKEII